MFALNCCGVLHRASTFPPRLDPELFSGLRLRPNEVPFWEDNLRLAAATGADPTLVDAARRAVERYRLQQSGADSIQSPLVRVLDRLGLPPARLKRWDERYFKSTVTRAVRAIRRRPGTEGIEGHFRDDRRTGFGSNQRARRARRVSNDGALSHLSLRPRRMVA